VDISRKLWEALDAEKQGFLSENDLIKNMGNINPEMATDEIRECFRKIDSEETGRITFEEFSKNFSLFWHLPNDEADPESSVRFAPPSMPANSEKGVGRAEGKIKNPAKSMNKKYYLSTRPLTLKNGTMKLAKYTMNQAEDIFDWIDSDDTGVVTLEEMRVALEFYIGSEFKEEQLERLEEMMKLQSLNGIPKEMFVTILKDIMARIKDKETRAQRSKNGTQRFGTGKPEDFDDAQRVSNGSKNAVIMQGFALGMGLTDQTLQERLAEQLAEKEKLDKRIQELRNAAQIERKTQQSLLKSMAEDQESLDAQNKSLREANERLLENVEELTDELEQSKLSTFSTFQQISKLEAGLKELVEEKELTESMLEDLKEELKSTQQENSRMKQELQGIRRNSVNQARNQRQRSISQQKLSTDLVRLKISIEEKYKQQKKKNKELKRIIGELQALYAESARKIEASEAAVEFWRRQVRRDSRSKDGKIDLASEIAGLAVGQRNYNKAGTLRTNKLGDLQADSNTVNVSEEEPGEEKLLAAPDKYDDEGLEIASTSAMHLTVEDESRGNPESSQRDLLQEDMRSIDTQPGSVNEFPDVKSAEGKARDLTAKLKSTEKRLQQALKRLDEVEQQLVQEKSKNHSEASCFCCC